TFQVDADGLLAVSAREKTTGVESAIVVKPSYGLTDDEVARMLQEGFAHAEGDRDARALAKDGDLLPKEERASLEALLAKLEAARLGTDHRTLKAAIEAVNHGSE